MLAREEETLARGGLCSSTAQVKRVQPRQAVSLHLATKVVAIFAKILHAAAPKARDGQEEGCPGVELAPPLITHP